jgi:LmbE family N-acetylglucosaminyl deacetylase
MADVALPLGRTLVLVAHPDDESVGCGVLLQRIREPIVVFATDGAPRDDSFWREHGSRLRYARVRQEEAYAALAPVGVSEVVFLAEQAGARELFVDQELYEAVPEAAELLTDLVARYRPEALLTLAYEGGHPDHDVCSFLAEVVARGHGLPVWEFPLYHRLLSEKPVFQQFLVDAHKEDPHLPKPGRCGAPVAPETVLDPTPEELEIKRQMLAAYPSQHPFLFEFDPAIERFRPQAAYDYSQPLHAGTLNYEAWRWPVTGNKVCAALTAYMQARDRRAV